MRAFICYLGNESQAKERGREGGGEVGRWRGREVEREGGKKTERESHLCNSHIPPLFQELDCLAARAVKGSE